MKRLLPSVIVTALFFSVPVLANAESDTGKSEMRINALTYHSEFDSAMTLVKRKDYDAAFVELKKFARYGEKRAQYLTGVFYISGYGTEVNAGEGLAWIKLALEQETTEWKQAYVEMTEKLTESQMKVIENRYSQLIEMYGVKKQFMRCKVEKAKWSNIAEPTCKKELFQRAFYKVNQFE
ncbi:hypothetical protein [Rheinheimera fenheensis]|uniref:hypothetical protein n=1 Tax=Rheinheimera fenheensis TaxID=3152295 RepID=UPI00325F8B5D